MIAPFVAYALISSYTTIEFPNTLFLIVGFTVAITLLVTLLTKPDDTEHLKAFYRKIRVGGPLWKPIANQLPDVKSEENLSALVLNWVYSLVLVYSCLFGIGKLIFRDFLEGMGFLLLAVVAGWLIYRDFQQRGWQKLT